MATQSLTVASMDNGNVTIVLQYNDATMRGTALIANNNSNLVLFAQFERNTGGNGVVATVPPQSSRTLTLPNGLQLGLDDETGTASITGAGANIRMTCTLG